MMPQAKGSIQSELHKAGLQNQHKVYPKQSLERQLQTFSSVSFLTIPIVGSLKEFRRHWPWMQHYGVPLEITLAANGKSAEMWIGRLIPGQFKNDQGEWMYGAHYRIDLIKEDGLWKFTWSEYVPGWFSASTLPCSSLRN